MKALEKGAWLCLQLFQTESRDFLLLHNSQFQEEREGVWKFEEERSYGWNMFCRMFATSMW
ncbi:hypothetical protein DRN79_04110 [Methanosarcinales archaeon]|nr:MAG: hypothetical protein DRN79_04110 [Methanosarcinales archaeon]